MHVFPNVSETFSYKGSEAHCIMDNGFNERKMFCLFIWKYNALSCLCASKNYIFMNGNTSSKSDIFLYIFRSAAMANLSWLLRRIQSIQVKAYFVTFERNIHWRKKLHRSVRHYIKFEKHWRSFKSQALRSLQRALQFLIKEAFAGLLIPQEFIWFDIKQFFIFFKRK